MWVGGGELTGWAGGLTVRRQQVTREREPRFCQIILNLRIIHIQNSTVLNIAEYIAVWKPCKKSIFGRG